MLSRYQLPHGRWVDLRYTDKVYDPNMCAIDTIMVADMFLPATARVLDVGTGTGVIALSLKRLNPKAEVHAVDIDPEAVRIAKENAKGAKLKVEIWEGDLAEGRQNFDMVVANLPTYDDEQIENEVLQGPRIAYYAGKDGLALYKKLFKQLDTVLKPNGIFVCECQSKLIDKWEKYVNKQGWLTMMKTEAALAFIRDTRKE